MKKEDLINLFKKIYTWCIGKGWNEKIVRIILAALFGVACAYLLNSCTLGYESASQKLNINIIPVEDWKK